MAGWSAIMDEGRWTLAEAEFRAAMAADPDWVLGRALVGRITRNVEEREELLDWIERHLDQAPDDERLLLDIYVHHIAEYNERDRGIAPDPERSERRQRLHIANSRRYLERHPGTPYVSAELVEYVHAADGAEAALHVLNTEVAPSAASIPFCLGYRARMLTELGRYHEAFAVADALDARLDDPLAPAQHVVRARILLRTGQLEEASARIDTALALDGNNLAAWVVRELIRVETAKR